MKPGRFHDAARAELLSEVAYYAKISPKLGAGLAAGVEQAIQLAAGFPEMGSPHKLGTRRVFPKKFPFSIVYLDGNLGQIEYGSSTPADDIA